MKAVQIMAGLVVGMIVALFTVAANAQAVCAARQDMVDNLKQTYGEQQSSVGISRNGAMVEVFTSPTGTWTIIITRPNGVSCLAATGQNWQQMERDVEELKS